MHPFRASLWLTLAVGLGTLIRSLAFTRVATVLAALALLVGAHALLRARTWGLALTSAASAAFAGAAALDMGPTWFWGVAVVGSAPLASTVPALRRIDPSAAAVFVGLALAFGLALAVCYREILARFP